MLPDPEHPQNKINENDQMGDHQALLANAQEAVEQARQYSPARLAQALVTYARLLADNEQYEQARNASDRVIELEQLSGNTVEALIILGICAAQTNQLDKAEQAFNQAAHLSRKINYLMGLARALEYLVSLVLLVRGEFHLALTLIEETGIIREEQGSKHWQEPFVRALIYEVVGDRRHCRQVLDELLLQIEPGTQLAAAYYFLWGRLALDEDEPDQAKEYLRLGLRVANRIGTVDLNLWIRLEYSRYHRLRNEPQVALTWSEDALNQARLHGSLYFASLALIERAQALWLSGNPSAAEDDLQEAVQILEPLKAAFDLTRALFLRALWQQQTNHERADAAWLLAAKAILNNGYAFILEKEQDLAFPLIAAYTRSKNSEVRSTTEEILRHLANVPPPPLRIATLGQFAVWKGRRRIADQVWARRKAGELLRFLLLQPDRAAGREVTIESLWPESDSGSVYDLLHQATSALRHALEPDLPDKFPSRYLKVEGEHIELVLPPGSVVDFEQFEHSLPMAIKTHSIDRLQEALNLYSGELFPSDRYADWSAEKRQALAELRQRGLVALAQSFLSKGQHFNAINACRQVLRMDEWNEDAVLLAMQAYAGLQDIPHALQTYLELERRLREDLGILPRSDLRALAQSLRQR